jgi:hypothetical protein
VWMLRRLMSSTVWPRTAGSVEFSNGRASGACLVLLLRSTKASWDRVWGGLRLLVIVGFRAGEGVWDSKCRRGQTANKQGRLPTAQQRQQKRLDRTGLESCAACLLAAFSLSICLSVCLFLTKLPAEGPETRLAFAITVLDWGFFLKRGGARNRWY